MLRTIKVIFLILLSLLPLSVGAALFGSKQPWTFMQGVGGLTIGQPYLVKGGWYLPVNCDITGVKKFTVKPTLANSALVWADTVVDIKGNEIYLTIETGLAGPAGHSSTCGPGKLNGVVDGVYSVFYKDPDGSTHAIGKVEIIDAKKP